MRKRLKWLVPLLLVVLIGSLLPVRWLTTPDHTVGEIIITTQGIGLPVIAKNENAITQPGDRVSGSPFRWWSSHGNISAH